MSDREALLAEARKIEREQLLAQAREIQTSGAGMSPVDKAAKVVEDAGAAVMDGPVGKALTWAGDKLERYVDAPIRAQITSLQKGESFGRSIQRGGEQMGKEPLATTKSGKEIGASIGIPTTALSEKFPDWFSETGEGLKLKRGGILDVSAAGVYGGLIQPSNLIPGEVLVGGAAKTAKAGGAMARRTAPVAELIEAAGKGKELLGKAGQAAQRGVFKVGEVMTRGSLKVDDAMKAANELKGGQLLIPDLYTKGAGKKIGDARDVIEGSGKTLPAGADAVNKLEKIRDMVKAAEDKAAKTPGSQQLLDRIDRTLEKAGQGIKGVEVEDIDDMIRDLNGIEYTEKGNPRSVEPRWAKPLAQIRGELEPMLGTTAEGAALSAAKKPYAALQTAKGQQRSGLATIASWTGGIGSAATAMAMNSPELAAIAAIAHRAMAPRTYFQIVGLAKLPAHVADGLMAAYQTGSQSKIAQSLAELAEKYPAEAARVVNLMTQYADSSSRAAAQNEGPMERRIRRTGE